MRVRKLLAYSLAVVLGLATTNRVIRFQAGRLGPPLSGMERTYEWRGFDVSYAEAGDPTDPTVVLLHSVHAAGTAAEFRKIFESIAEDYHVIAPELLGYGRSDRPPIAYEGSLYERLISDFLSDVTESPIVVASSLTGGYAAAAAQTVDVEDLVLISPTDTVAKRRLSVRELLRAPILGTAFFNALVSRPSLRYYDRKEGFTDPGAIDESLVEYQWRTSHQENARYAPASFLSGYLNATVDLESALPEVDSPVTLVWGEAAKRPPLSYGRELAERGDTRLVTIEDAKLLPHYQHPEAFLSALAPTLARLGDIR
ncbi:MAG: alpha/beta fold hydrolase [Halodesulfurarchaeum sp.]